MNRTSRYPVLRFEREADPVGDWIPLAVRMKLDLAACKIGLDHWQGLSAHARAALLDAPAETDDDVTEFARTLRLATDEAGVAPPQTLSADKHKQIGSWKDPGPPPPQVARLLEHAGRTRTWQRLDRFGRYVACSVARKNDIKRLVAALDEVVPLPEQER